MKTSIVNTLNDFLQLLDEEGLIVKEIYLPPPLKKRFDKELQKEFKSANKIDIIESNCATIKFFECWQPLFVCEPK